MPQNYSNFPASEGLTIKPPKTPYDNLPSIINMEGGQTLISGPTTLGFNQAFLSKSLHSFAVQDTSPIPNTCDREGYHGDHHFEWWYSGLVTFLRVTELVETYTTIQDGDVYFELGCATGRVLRHALFSSKYRLKVMGCDLNARHVDWVQQFLPKEACVFQNTALPSLPLPDQSVNIILACSVFTHIDDLESAWLMELSRILKPEGLAFLTIMSEKYWSKIGCDPQYMWIKPNLLRLDCEYNISETSFMESMPANRVVFGEKTPPYNTSIFHHTDYIRSVWGKYFDIVDIKEQDFDIQDLVILRKK